MSAKLAELEILLMPDQPFSAAAVDQFLADPGASFGGSVTKMQTLPPSDLERLQIAALKRRFGQLRGNLPMLDRLADNQHIDAIDAFDDVVPLLFDHATYKSYPASLLDQQRFKQLTAWLNKLTTIDLSQIDVSACRGVDDWLTAIKRETPLSVVHTSGTTGSMSFLPWSKREFRTMVSQFPLLLFRRFGEEAPPPAIPLNVDCIYPYFRSGFLSHTVINDSIAEIIAGSEERFHAAYPGRMSADMALLAARRRAAEAKGQLDTLQISPEIAARREEFEALQRNMPAHIEQFFETIRTELAGKQVFMMATTNLLYGCAEKGVARGLRGIFAPNSVIMTGGGDKGVKLPPDWKTNVQTFFGVDHMNIAYGMSESSVPYFLCEHDHFHGVPWVIPFVLDEETNKPLPRTGTVTGRFAFYDLLPDTRWGGFVTGDEVTMTWDTPCACGRTGHYLGAKIQRISAKRTDGGEEKLNCAASTEAYTEALDFLNEGTI
jgi:hypothetical protein